MAGDRTRVGQAESRRTPQSSQGNLVDAFHDRATALDCLAGIAQAEPAAADEVYLVAQDDKGNTVGETIYASAVSVPV